MRASRLLTAAFAVALLGLAWLGHAATGEAAEGETTILGDLLSRALSTPTSRVSIGAVDGALSSDATIRDVAIADRNGVWLRLDTARLIWRRTALLSRRLEIDRLEIGRLEVLRRPLPSATPPSQDKEALLPDLPVKVVVKAFALNDLVLGEPVLGEAARIGGAGQATLGDPREGLDLGFGLRRLDKPGTVTLKLAYVPDTARLEVKLAHDEPAGGLAARLMNLPGLPPVSLDLDGRGTLDAWNAALAFKAGEGIGADGKARIDRVGTERRMVLDLASRVEGLMPGPLAAIFSGTTRLDGALRFADAGAVQVDRFELTSRTARLALNGGVDAARNADLTLQARALPTEGSVTKAGEATLESFNVDASVKGPLDAPAVRGTLRAAGLSAAGSRLGRASADLVAEPLPRAAEGQSFRLAAEAHVEGLHLADPALRRAIGPQASFRLAGRIDPNGVADLDAVTIEAPTAHARYAGRIGRDVVAGTLQAELPDLAAFSLAAGRPLGGRVAVKALLSGDPGRAGVTADVEASTEKLVLGTPALDRTLGRDPRFSGRLTRLPDGYAVQAARLTGHAVTATIDGRATETKADMTGRVDLADLATLDSELAGRAALDARLTGSLERPDLALALAAPEARAMGRPVRDLAARATVTDATGALDGTLALSGRVDGKPLAGDLHLARRDADWLLDRLSLTLGSVALTGRAAVDPGSRLGEGEVTLKAGDLDDLSALALTRLQGRLDAAITLSRAGGRQDARVRATGEGVRGAGVALSRLDADLSGTDLWTSPRVSGRLNADRLVAGAETIEAIRLDAKPAPDGSDLVLQARARGFALDGAARLIPADRPRLDLTRLSAVRGADRLALAGPATITFRDEGVTIAGLAIAAGSGRASLDGTIGQRLDLRLGLTGVPLAMARIASPSLALSGALDAEALLAGPAASPEGRYSLSLSRLVTPETRSAGLPPIDAKASGRIEDGRAGLDGTVTAGRGLQLALSGSLPVEAGGALSVRTRGTLDAALANTLLAAGGQRLTGRVALDAGVTGTLQAPKVDGSAVLTGGSFTDPLQGVRLTDVQGRIVGRGDTIVIERLTAATRNGGTVQAQGRVAVEPAAGFPGNLTIRADRAELVSSPLMTLISGLNLSLTGPLARTPRITGQVDVVSLDVSVPDRLPATVQPLPGIRHVNAPPQTRARLAARAKREAASRRGAKTPPFLATLDIAVNAPGRITVRGRGIDAELGGNLRLTGTSAAPVANGAFAMRRGRIQIVGQRLDFARGRLTFAGDLTAPDLDFLAQSQAGDVTAKIAVTGPANQPDFALTSEPPLPQDEVLSRLLFKKASGGLSPFQALQLAQGVAQLSGGAGGPDVFESARKGLGLDSLDIQAGSKGGAAVGLSRALGERVNVGVRAGARPEDSAATITYDVTGRIKVQGEAGADGRTAVGVGAEWEY
ncbi:translocation/assembly module TamB domain-containing protein [Methylobacterium currus]|uniref:translocation/assembly module TamB domain-containing protein n=1 Tax=Methylobacterium currus TaxID=2051553 RepID=UPI001E38E4A9|nr:translocation/assembly module TamB domain-containing protein [Methylobacterium currus]UHC17479.1 translocation/assembly module TamB domain-containing protein [Methylobacterium currus]